MQDYNKTIKEAIRLATACREMMRHTYIYINALQNRQGLRETCIRLLGSDAPKTIFIVVGSYFVSSVIDIVTDEQTLKTQYPTARLLQGKTLRGVAVQILSIT